MNFVGMIMFLAVGGTALHYWHGYQPEHKLMYDTTERQVNVKYQLPFMEIFLK